MACTPFPFHKIDDFEVAAAQGGSDGAAFLKATGLDTGPDKNSSSGNDNGAGTQSGATTPPPAAPPAWSVFVVLICGVGGVGTDRVLHGLQVVIAAAYVEFCCRAILNAST